MSGNASGAGVPRWMVLVMLAVGALMFVVVPLLVATVERPLVLYILGFLILVGLACSVPLFVLARRELREKGASQSQDAKPL